jgi:divalent metal cation (Fe/Co/Zn/Cd) transporter
MDSTRADQVRQGLRIERLSVLWMVIEMGVSIWAGIAARSLLLTAFGIDSLIELVSGGILLWRLSMEARAGDAGKVMRAEERAARVVALALVLLCVYVLLSAGIGFLTRGRSMQSSVGIGISLAAVLFMPYLAVRKRAIATRIQSEALDKDATSSITCAFMAGTVLAGLVLNTLIGWWWVEDVGALLFLVWLGHETWEAVEEVRRPEKG